MVSPTLLFIGPIGPFETALIFMMLVLLFGADRIPKLAGSLGSAISKFEEGKQKAKEEVEDVEAQVEDAVDESVDETQADDQTAAEDK